MRALPSVTGDGTRKVGQRHASERGRDGRGVEVLGDHLDAINGQLRLVHDRPGEAREHYDAGGEAVGFLLDNGVREKPTP